jgi:hypothetical protein
VEAEEVENIYCSKERALFKTERRDALRLRAGVPKTWLKQRSE